VKEICSNTFLHYREILETGLKNGYTFKTCKEYLKEEKKSDLICVLRHDVDLSPERSIELAKIENLLGIKGSYFFRTHANEYNCLSYETISLIKDIHEMGHEIGLHAEPIDILKATGYDPSLSLQMGKQLLESIIGASIVGVASHNDPTPDNNLDFFKVNSPQNLGFSYEAYDSVLNLFEKSYYITDSHPWYWRTFEKGQLTDEHNCLCSYFEESKTPIYSLTHPHMWYHKHFHRVHY
jgi:hypothetical protein